MPLNDSDEELNKRISVEEDDYVWLESREVEQRQRYLTVSGTLRFEQQQQPESNQRPTQRNQVRNNKQNRA